MTDYSLWEVIKNGNKVLKRTVGETKQEYEPTTAEEKQDRRNEMKARGTLLMALPNKDQLKFHSYKDAKWLMKAIEMRYGGNKESKKVQRTLLKQQYENFAGSSSRNKEEIETISLDDLYNNLKMYEPKITGSSSTRQNPQNVAFVSSNSTNSNSNTNEAANTAYRVSAAHTQSNPTFGDKLSDVVICAFLASQPNSPQLAQEDLEQIDLDDLEEMDLQWEMAMLTIRARRFIKRTGKKLDVNGQRVGFDRSKVECYNCHKNGHFAREYRAPRNQENRGRENSRRTVTVETPTENVLVAQDGIGGYNWSYQAKEEHPTNYALMAHTSSGSSSNSDSDVDSCSKSCVKAYATLKEQYDSLSLDYKKKNSFRPPVIEDGNSDDDSECDGKADEGFFVRYSIVSKAIRVFNKRTRIVEEILNIRFLENTPNVTGNRPDWLFDVDSLTISMNYVPVVAGNQTNGIAGTRDNIVTDPKASEEDAEEKPTKMDENGASDKDEKDDQATRSEFERLLQQEKQTLHPNSTNSINIVSTPVSAAGLSFTNDDPSSVNVAEATNAFEEHLFERFSPFKNAFTFPPISNVTPMDDTGIFGNAYDDEDVGQCLT
ncbi:ribonuclease H-like domain-containing protein [Tanacetum coccineum]|uniref:Ribonuclease H-like domain-containing protein n=1 Tax=Tanacetum coccineum TaxID=301880 RepID=A0ABQ4WJ14_9ASTR